MNRRTAIQRLLVGGAGSFLPRLLGQAAPPQNSPDDQETFIIRSDVRLVLLDVSVKSHDGGFVRGLEKENFKVFENGRPQTIRTFDSSDVPVTVGILVDESRSMTPKRTSVLVAAETFIQESNREDEIFVLNFNNHIRLGLPHPMLFSDDLEQLHAALYRGIPDGKTALNDAVVAGLEHLQLGRREKKTLVIISDGGDNASWFKRGDMLDRVEKGLATIYTIGLYDPDDPEIDPGLLRQLARISGGEAFFPAKPPDTVPICRQIAKDIRNRYTLGFLPQPGNGASSVRQIRVHVSAPGHGSLSAHTKSSYRYEAADASKKQ